MIDILEAAYGSTHPEVAQAYVDYVTILICFFLFVNAFIQGLLLNSQDQMTKASTFLKAALNVALQLYGNNSKKVHQIRVRN